MFLQPTKTILSDISAHARWELKRAARKMMQSIAKEFAVFREDLM